MRARGASWGKLGGVGRLLDHHLGWWGLLGLFVEQMMHFNKHTCSLSHKSVPSAVDSPCMSFTASLIVSRVSVDICVLDNSQVIVFGAVVVGFVTVVNSNVAMKQLVLGLERGGWRLSCGVIGWPGSECRHS